MPRALVTLLSLGLLLLLWEAGARIGDDPRRLPGPGLVALLLMEEAERGRLWFHLGATLARVAAAFALAMSVGLALGLLMGRLGRWDRWLDPWLVVFLNLPALVVMVLAYIWMGLTEAAAVTAVAVNKIPLVTAMTREGVRALDPALDAMARVFRMGPVARLRHVVLPQLAPHIAAAARSGLALIWKIVLVVEFLGRPNGIGFQIHLQFQLFEVGRVMAYAIAFILVMLAVEKLVLQPWEARARRWRAA